MEEQNNCKKMIIEEQVIDFFRKRISKKIDKDSYITDFCKDEDDAYYLFLDFFSEFNIENGYLNLDDYFFQNGNFLYKIIKYFNNNGSIKNEKNEKKQISIKHLTEVAIKKQWFDPS